MLITFLRINMSCYEKTAGNVASKIPQPLTTIQTEEIELYATL